MIVSRLVAARTSPLRQGLPALEVLESNTFSRKVPPSIVFGGVFRRAQNRQYACRIVCVNTHLNENALNPRLIAS